MTQLEGDAVLLDIVRLCSLFHRDVYESDEEAERLAPLIDAAGARYGELKMKAPSFRDASLQAKVEMVSAALHASGWRIIRQEPGDADLIAAARNAQEVLRQVAMDRRTIGPLATAAQQASWQLSEALRGRAAITSGNSREEG